MYIALTSDTLSDGDLYQLRHHRRCSSGSTSCPASREVHDLRREKRHPDQGRSRRADRAQHDLRRTHHRDSRRHLLRGRGSVRWREQVVRPAAEWAGRRRRRLSQHHHRTGQGWLAGLSARRREGDRRRAGRTLVAAFFCARLQSAGFGHCARGLASGRRERRRGRAFGHAICFRRLQRELPGSIHLIPTFDRSQSHRPFGRTTCRRRSSIAFVLVILVIFVFLGRAGDTLIPVVALPLSLPDHFPRRCGRSITRSTT